MQRRSLPAWFAAFGGRRALRSPPMRSPTSKAFGRRGSSETRSGQALIDELPDGAVLINDTGAGELAAGDFAGLS